tara:strand:- start:128 stop:469 length:342 start_codon:yes stop_codon:yes gene_type:complete
MKNLLFILITLITIANVSYASFPVVESNAKILAIESEDDQDDEPSLLEAILLGVLVVSILGFAAYFLFKAWWRAWRDNIRWVKLVTYILLGFFLLFLILVLILNAAFSGGSFM